MSEEEKKKPSKPAKPLRTKQLATRARHRLRSIYRDAMALEETLQLLREKQEQDPNDAIFPSSWAVVANERCGSWYISTKLPRSSITCYFKSTDGHTGNWFLSLKRLNLPLIELVSQQGGCRLVDSSTRKVLPDSFARTIPIWACVMNRVAVKYRQDLGLSLAPEQEWDTRLYTPSIVVSTEEHEQMAALIDKRVESLYQSRAIVHPSKFVEMMKKPLRAVWYSNGEMLDGATSSGQQLWEDAAQLQKDYFVIVCHNPSIYKSIHSTKSQHQWMDGLQEDDNAKLGYYYSPGAADDEESWARKLTPPLFWDNAQTLVDPKHNDDEIDYMIDSIIEKDCEANQQIRSTSSNNHCDGADRIGNMNLWIGSRRVSRPPDCWQRFDAILNVTNTEYPGMTEVNDAASQTAETTMRYYLQLPVAEGKRDKTELERWLHVGLIFLFQHLQLDRRVLVHCAQGKDRSVAVVLAFLAITCHRLTFPLQPEPSLLCWELNDLYKKLLVGADSPGTIYLHSGIPSSVVNALLDSNGHEVFLDWVHCQLGHKDGSKPLADKESLRVVFHLVRQDREVAEPTRSTFQKLNRFFMSSPRYRQNMTGA